MNLSAKDEEFEARWSAWLLDRSRRGTRPLLFMVLGLYPTFGILDWLIAPRQWLWLLWGTRGVVTLATFVMFGLLRSPSFDRYPHALSSAFIVLISTGISVMTVFMGGLASPYYAGLTLIIVATGLLFVWPTPIVIGTHVTIIGTFIALNLIFHRTTTGWLTAVSNQFFLVSTAIIAGSGQILMYRSQREQIANQLVIERTQKNLEQAHAELKQLDRFKSEFFANITHELKTPLTMMLAPLELLVDGQLGVISDAQRSTLMSVQRNGVKLLRLIGDLLDLSRIEESRLRLRVAEHDLVTYLSGLVAQAEPLAQRKSLELRFESDVTACPIWCDLERIERVFVNLLSNATKFTPPEGKVTVSVKDEKNSVRVEVTDTGTGFPPEMAEKIFQRFFQVDMAETRRHGGTGIGLALAKELIELHSGQIWAEPAAGGGATFKVRLHKGRDHINPEVVDRRGPRVERVGGSRAADHGLADWRLDEGDRFRLIDIDHATEQRIVERDVDEEARGHSVLVVEDTPDVTRVIRLALHHEFKVLAAPDGLKGLELARKHRPTVIITDLMMPGIDGLELTRRLRADPTTRQIPIVMLSARSELDERVAGLETGVNAYLAKPFSAKELISTVRAQLESREAAAALLMEQTMDSLQTVAGGLAHQIRNPLNYISNAMAAVQRDTEKLLALTTPQHTPETNGANGATDLGKIAGRMEKMFDTAQSGVRRIGATVDLMIRYSREGYSRAVQPYDVHAAIHDVIALLRPSVGFEVAIATDFQGDGEIACVPEEFNQVLTNLLENALHAVPVDGSGRIAIRCVNEGTALVCSIRDNGSGIAPADQLKIFAPFYSTKEAGRGMGLGLSIVQRVVSALGGTIRVQSELGSGTEFVLRLATLKHKSSPSNAEQVSS
jgi:signal transduction histidine kinase